MLNHFRERLARRRPAIAQRPRLFFDTSPEVIYAVGDVHGCYDLLLKMEKKIAEDAASISGEKWIVLLGDYVDRGPQSADVLDHLLLSPPSGFIRHCLAGNHESLMLSYLAQPSPDHLWLRLGGAETLRSYGLTEVAERRSSMETLLASYIPTEHLDFLNALPSLLAIPGFVFVHAGLRPGLALDQQSEQDLLWIRPGKQEPPPMHNLVIVHGHTPVPQIEIRPGRINVDTGAFTTSRLSCIRIDRNGKMMMLEAN